MRSRTFWALFVLSAAVLFFRLGDYGLVETSDARYAEISAEMVRSGDYLTPRLNYIKHFHKPPLTYWATAAGYHALGLNEWGARASLGLCALGTLLLTYSLARRLYGERAARLSWLILLSMGGFLGAHRLLTTDPLLSLVMTGALYAFWRWQEAPAAGLSHLFFACLGLAMLTKGPVGVLVVWLIVLVWALAAGRLRQLGGLRWGAGLAIFALVGLPWYLYVVWQNDGLLRYFLFGQLAERVSGEMGHRYPVYYIAAMFLLYGLPWTPFLAPALWSGLRRREGAKPPSDKLFLAAWLLVPVVFFSLPATKLPNYILPALPAAAIWLAAWWGEEGRLGAAGRLAAAALALALLIYPALLIVRPAVTPGLEGLVRVVAVLGVSAAALCGASALTGARRPALSASAALLPAALLAAGLQVERLPLRTCRPLGVRLAAGLKADGGAAAAVATYRCRLYGLPFYCGRRIIEAGGERETQFEGRGVASMLPASQDFLAGWAGAGRRYCVLPEEALDDFRGLGYRVLGRHRKWVLIVNDSP
jgi:4-amino-4-deoxy-L-arabinose transferase